MADLSALLKRSVIFYSIGIKTANHCKGKDSSLCLFWNSSHSEPLLAKYLFLYFQVLTDHKDALFVLIAIFIIFCTTATLCLVFVPKVT